MPEIKDYAPQVEAQGPIGGTSPNLEAVTAKGRGIERLGNAVEQGSDLILRAQTQEEVSNINAGFAQARADWTLKLKSRLADGSLDVDKFKQEFDDYTSKMGDDISTPGGKNYFNKQQGRLSASLTTSAAMGQAAIKGRQQADNWQSSLDHSSIAVANDPSQFDDSYHSMVDGINEMISANPKLAGHEEKFRRQAGETLSVAAVKGWAQVDTDKAQKLLDNGAFDQYLDADKKTYLQGVIKTQARANDIEDERKERLVEKAQKTAQDASIDKWLRGMYKGTTSAQNILDDPSLKGPVKHEVLGWLAQANKKDVQPDPETQWDIYRRINLPEKDEQAITDPAQLRPYFNQLGPEGMTKANDWIAKSAVGQEMKANRLRLIDIAKSKLVKEDMGNGFSDGVGKQNLNDFTQSLQKEEDDLRAKGKSPMDLYKSSSPDYFGNHIKDFESPMAQRMEKAAQKRVKDQSTVEKIKPGESAADYLKRIGK